MKVVVGMDFVFIVCMVVGMLLVDIVNCVNCVVVYVVEVGENEVS